MYVFLSAWSALEANWLYLMALLPLLNTLSIVRFYTFL